MASKLAKSSARFSSGSKRAPKSTGTTRAKSVKRWEAGPEASAFCAEHQLSKPLTVMLAVIARHFQTVNPAQLAVVSDPENDETYLRVVIRAAGPAHQSGDSYQSYLQDWSEAAPPDLDGKIRLSLQFTQRMNPEDFATVASEFVKGGTAAHCRTAIGRAYYSSFLLAFVLLKKDIRFPKSGDKHAKVRHYLENCGHPLLKKVASGLDDLRDSRNSADYDMDNKAVENKVMADFQIDQARRLNADLKSVLTGPDRAKVIAAIADYRRKINDF